MASRCKPGRLGATLICVLSTVENLQLYHFGKKKGTHGVCVRIYNMTYFTYMYLVRRTTVVS